MRNACLVLAMHLVFSVAAHAQSRTYDVDIAAGTAITAGLYQSHNRGGPLLRLGVTSRSEGRKVRHRLDAEVFAVGPSSPKLDLGAADGIRSLAVTYNALLGPSRVSFAPYALVGAGLGVIYHTIPDSFPGIFVSARLGAGIRRRFSRVDVSAEVALVRPVRQFGSNGYVPISVGVSF